MDRINAAAIHVQLFAREVFGQDDALSPCAVQAADVDAKMAVEEDPDVVVALEDEFLILGVIFEVSRDRAGKLAILAAVGARFAIAFVDTNRQKCVGRILISICIVLTRERDGLVKSFVDAGDVVIPPLEDFGACIEIETVAGGR